MSEDLAARVPEPGVRVWSRSRVRACCGAAVRLVGVLVLGWGTQDVGAEPDAQRLGHGDGAVGPLVLPGDGGQQAAGGQPEALRVWMWAVGLPFSGR